jgi:2-hydroxychromene-2-carboxylate isomerase
VRWPPEVPFDSAFAMRAATFAAGAGKTVAFALAAFRQAYAGGRDLSDPDNVCIAAAACEIHPRALLKGADLASVRERLAEATAAAPGPVPAIVVDGCVYAGEDAPELAAA